MSFKKIFITTELGDTTLCKLQWDTKHVRYFKYIFCQFPKKYELFYREKVQTYKDFYM